MFFNLLNNYRGNDWYWELIPIQYEARDMKNYSGRIILPQSILRDLVEQNVQPPYIFKISNKETELSTFCGVLEFTSSETIVLVPQWIFQQLDLENASEALLRYAKVENGVFLKLLPHNVEFLDIESPKVELEKSLRNYQVLSEGDEIVLYFEEHGTMRFTVSEVQPNGDAIYIVDTDLKVDFLPPLGYKEKIEKEKSVRPYLEVSETEETFKRISMKKEGLFFDFKDIQDNK